MAKVIIKTDDGSVVSVLHVSNQYGPWTDGGDTIEHIHEKVNEALRREGDEA